MSDAKTDNAEKPEAKAKIAKAAGYGQCQSACSTQPHHGKLYWKFQSGWCHRNRQRLTGTTDFLFSPRAYWRIIELEYYRDPFSNTEITNRVDFLADYSFRILNERSGEYTHHALAKISTDITSNLDVDISFIWDRILNPQATDDGTVEVQQ